METRLHLLESFAAQGSDGKQYLLHGYEHLTRLEGVPDLQGQWEATGVAEYRLADGRRVDVDREGGMTVVDSGVRLERAGGERASAAPHG